MANTVSRLTANGNYFIAGQFDEVTFDPNSGYKKNILPYSQQFNQTSAWYAVLDVIVNKPPGIAPDGTATATLLTETLTNNSHWITNAGGLNCIPYGTYTFSCYFKPASGDRNFFLQFYDNAGLGYCSIQSNTTGGILSGASASGYYTNGSGSIVSVGNGWFRMILTTTLGPSNSFNIRIALFNNGAQYYQGNGNSNMYIWGAQIEAGTSATAYEVTGATDLPISGTSSRLDSTGNMYVTGTYDEFTKGMNLVQNGLIYYMDPSKQESWNGNTKIYDITGTYGPGTIYSGYNYNSNNGGVIQLDGLTGYIDTNIFSNTAPNLVSTFPPSAPITMSTWAKFTSNATQRVLSGGLSNGATGTIFGQFEYGGFGIAWGIPYSGNGVFNPVPQFVGGVVRVNNPGGTSAYTSNVYAYPNLNQWYNFTWVYSAVAGLNTLYVNGTSLGNTPAAPVGLTSSEPYYGPQTVQIGSNGPYSTGNMNCFPGQIGQCLMYNRTLSAAEVLQNYNEMRSQYGV